MAGRNRLPHAFVLHGHSGHPGPMYSGSSVMRHPIGPPPVIPAGLALAEQKMLTQHAEIQRLLTENQRLAATHVALRQELSTTQQEIQRFQQTIAVIQAEKEQQFRALAEKAAKMEADLRGTEPLKVELHQLRADAQKFNVVWQELGAQVQQLTQDLQQARVDVQAVPTLKLEIDGLRTELERTRAAVDYEKKANAEMLEQGQAMDKNLVSMAREVEKLRAELMNADKRARSAYVGAFGGPDTGYLRSSQALYGDGYSILQGPAGVESDVPYGAGPVTAWGVYDVPLGRAHLARSRVSQLKVGIH